MKDQVRLLSPFLCCIVSYMANFYYNIICIDSSLDLKYFIGSSIDECKEYRCLQRYFVECWCLSQLHLKYQFVYF